MFGTRKLGKTSTQRKALLRQLVTDLLDNGKIETTFYRAKEVQPVVEKMITFEFSHFLSPQSIFPSARNLNTLYRNYYENKK